MAITYKKAGVDIDAGNEVVKRIKKMVSGIGGFGGMYKYKNLIFVQSIDGVGTKMKIAAKYSRWETMGHDIVAHSCNDLLCQGATPLTFLDYIASSKIDPNIVEKVIKGIVKECKANGIKLVGGETAEMPGVYEKGEYDLVGTIMGVMKKSEEINGKNIKAGDKVYGLASLGLHTNGYSLARKALRLNKKTADLLLKPHQNYWKIFNQLRKKYRIKGIAHITGGGFLENIPRILPKGVGIEIYKGTWPVLPIFKMIQAAGNISEQEMYRTFNMGIGLVLISNQKLPGYEIGRVVKGEKKVSLI